MNTEIKVTQLQLFAIHFLVSLFNSIQYISAKQNHYYGESFSDSAGIFKWTHLF